MNRLIVVILLFGFTLMGCQKINYPSANVKQPEDQPAYTVQASNVGVMKDIEISK